MEALRRIARRLTPLIVVGAGFFLQGLTAVTGVITARVLGVTGRGEIAMVAVISGIACTLTYGGGLPNTVAKTLAERRLSARDVIAPFARRWAVGALIPAVAAAGYLWVSLDAGGSLHIAVLAALGGVLTVQLIAFRIALGCLQGEGAITPLIIAGMTPQVALTVGLIALWVAAPHADSIVVALVMVGANILAVGITIRSLRPRSAEPVEGIDRRELNTAARHSFISSVGIVDGLGADRILVGSLIGTASLGLYSAATAVANLSSLAGAGLAYILLPKVAAAERDEAERRTVVRWTLFAMVTTTLIVGALQLAVGPIIRTAFGAEFAPAIPAARWLILADGLLAFRRVLIAIMQGRGHGATASKIELVVGLATIAGLIWATTDDDLVRVGQVMAAAGLATVLGFTGQILRSRPPTQADGHRAAGAID